MFRNVAFLVALTISGLVQAQAPVADWWFDENQGTTVVDHSPAGYNNDASLYGNITWEPGSLYFDGFSTWGTVPDNDSFIFNTALSIHAIVTLGSLDGVQTMIRQHMQTGESEGWLFRVNSGHVYGEVKINNINYSVVGTTLLNTGIEYILSMIWSDNSLKLYIDGVQDAYIATNGNGINSMSDITIGRLSADYEHGYFNGWINNLKVLNYEDVPPGGNSGNFSALYDAESWQAQPNTNFNGTMWVGRWDGGAQRAHYYFDILGTIPAGVTITEATFSGYIYQDIYGSFSITVSRILEPWVDNELTWNNQPTIAPGGVQMQSPTISGWQNYAAPITQVVQDIVDSGVNFGIVVRKTDESTGDNVSFATIESEQNPAILYVEWQGGAQQIEIVLSNPYPSSVPRGGTFEYGALITSGLPVLNYVDIWTEAVLPNGNPYGPIWQINNFPMGPNTVIDAQAIVQVIPLSAPLGNYTFRMNAGVFPGVILGQDQFAFEVTAATDNAQPEQEWRSLGLETAFGNSLNRETTEVSYPDKFTLSKAYPNPFNSSTTLVLSLSEAANVDVVVYNLAGQQIETLADGRLTAGAHELIFNPSELASGVYFVQAAVNGFSAGVQKIVYAR